ncbi:EamA family transporter, partial [Nanoarchaeota archaeon]
MSWILFSVLAALMWAVVNIVDKYVLTKWVKNPMVNVIILGFVSLLAGVFVYFFKGLSELSYVNVLIALAVGGLYVLVCWFYFKAIQVGEVSRVVPLFHLSPLFVLIFAGVFLGEVFSFSKYFGIFLLIIGAIMISSEKLTKIRFGKAAVYMTLSALAVATYEVIMKHLLNFADFWTIFSYI